MSKSRILLVACVLAAVAFLATSCKKNEEKASALITTSALQADNDDRVYIDFSDSNRLKWNGGDRIMVYNFNLQKPKRTEVVEWRAGREAEGQTTAWFEGPFVSPPQSDEGLHFIYPAQMTSSSVDDENRITITVDDMQRYTELKTANNSIITTIQPGTLFQWAQSENKDFSLNSVFGVARIYMVGNKEVAKIELDDNDRSLAGSAKLSLPDFDLATLVAYFQAYKNGAISYLDLYDYLSDMLSYYPMPTGYTMTLNCANYTNANGVVQTGVQLTNPDPKSFFIVLRPGALSKGFTVRVYFTDHTGVTIDQYANTDYLENPRKFCIIPGRIQAIHFRDENGSEKPVEEFEEFTW